MQLEIAVLGRKENMIVLFEFEEKTRCNLMKWKYKLLAVEQVILHYIKPAFCLFYPAYLI